ncbi:MAG: PTS sugar transporter subunit IIA [Butyricicoccus sp.]
MNSENKYIAIEGQALSCEEAIELCGQALCRAGYVAEGFSQACIDREKEYPTGLCTDIPVAIPHCKSETILHDGVCYLRLKEPVEFRRMDDDEETVVTRSIFNIAIQGANNHLEFLQQLMGVVTDAELIEQIEQMDIGEVPAVLAERFGKGASA